MDRQLYSELRKLDRHDLRRVLIYVRGLLHARGDDSVPAGDDPDAGSVSYRLETVRCGKPGCKTCPHGPYWYAYYRDGDKLKSRYIGKERPASAEVPQA